MFVPRRVAVKEIIPLAVAMSMNVILPNLSLAFSSVTFYQVARILLTPTVALMDFVLYRKTLPRNAIYALVPACLGVGMVSYYDSLPTDNVEVKTTSGLGVIFAFTGIFASSLYTVWIGSYHKKLQMNSMQLLYNQAPVSAFLLLYVIPFVDTFPVWSEVPVNRWVMIMMVSDKITQLSFWFNHEHEVKIEAHKLTQLITAERTICLPHQYVTVFYHCTNWPSVEYGSRASENLLYCSARLDNQWPDRGRQEHNWGFYRYWGHYCVSLCLTTNFQLLLQPCILDLGSKPYPKLVSKPELTFHVDTRL